MKSNCFTVKKKEIHQFVLWQLPGLPSYGEANANAAFMTHEKDGGDGKDSYVNNLGVYTSSSGCTIEELVGRGLKYCALTL